MPSRWVTAPLLALLPLVWRAGLALARAATGDERLSRFLAPGVALALWLLGIHALGLITHSFYAGLLTGTVLPAAFGLASMRLRVPVGDRTEPTSRWMWLGMIIAAALLVGPEFNYSKHDECLITGHLSIPAEMQNGIYPPRHLTFPNYELRYHYGIDLAAAAASSLLGRIDVHTTVHLLAILLWAYAFCLYWLLGERLIGGRASGPVTAFCVLFAGGAPFFCRPVHPVLDYMTSICAPAGTWITPPFVSSFLQHPWSLGMPLFACILLVLARFSREPISLWGWGLLSLLTVVLSFAQVVLFVCLVPSFVVGGAIEGRHLSLAKLARLMVWAAIVTIAARLLHGFFAPAAEPAAGRVELHPFWLDASAWEWFSWHAQGFGALLPLGLLGSFFLRKHRALLLLMGGGGLLVRDALRYTPSWNIVKFSTVTQIVLALFAAAALTKALSRPRWRLAGAAGFALCTVFGFAWPIGLTLIPSGHDCVPPGPTGADALAVDFLRQRVKEGEAVFRSERADTYAIYGGLPQPTWDWATRAFGFSEILYDERRGLLDHPDDLDAYRLQGFRWFVLSSRDARVLATVTRWAQENRAERAAEFPPLTIFRLR
jgi:hypothetical protein